MARERVSTMRAGAWLTVKQHSFEFGVVALAASALSVAMVLVTVHFASVGLPAACLAASLSTAQPQGGCSGLLQQFGRINEDEASRLFAATAIFPFASGLILGLPIVGRELENRTVQTAWWLEPSRTRWLSRQLVAPTVLLLFAAGAVGATAYLLQTSREGYSPATAETLALFGWPVLARAFAALGIGLFAGALLGRILPSLIVGSAICFLVLAAGSTAQAQWMHAQVAPVPADAIWHGHSYGVAFVDDSGRTYSEPAAVALAPTDGGNPYDWLAAHGYREIDIGVSDAVALQWIPYEVGVYTLAGTAALVAAFVTVTRRRTT